MIEKWELAHFPFEKDPLRFKARVRGTEEDLKELISKLPVECGRPFITLSQEYDWAFYLYKLDDIARLKAVDIFTSFSQEGTVIDSPTLHVEKEIPPMLEDVLEVAAKNLVKATPEPPPPAPPPAPPPPPAKLQAEKPASTLASAPTAVAGFEPSMQENVSTPLNPSYSFNSFIVGPNNRFTHAAAQAVAENPGKIYNPFFIYGGVGLGKTHLMQAIGNFVLAKNPQLKTIFISTEKFMSMVIEGIRRDSISNLREQFRHLDLLLIDDIQFLSGSESTQEEFFHVFNNLHQVGKQIVITSDRPPKQLSTLEDRLRSRFEWGLITDLKAPNLETRVAILKSKADQIDLNLTNEQLMFVAEKSKSNIRELEGVVKKIYATASLMNTKIDLNLLKGLLEEEHAEERKESKPEPLLKVEIPKAEPPKVELPKIEIPKVELPKAEAPKVEIPKEPEKKKSSELESIMVRLNEALEQAAPPPPAQKEVKPEPAPAAEAPKPPAPKPPPGKVVLKAAEPPKPPELQSYPIAKKVDPQEAEFDIATRARVVEPKKSDTPKVEAAAAAPPPPVAPAVSEETLDPDEPDTDLSLKAVEVVCFYPAGKIEDFRKLRSKFNLILKKHKLKFRLHRLAERPFNYEGKPDYTVFAKVCREKKCSVALVLGPPPTPLLSEDDFAGMLSAALDEERIALQFMPWSEMTKDYRYLNCALDLSLLIPVSDPKKGAS